MAKKKGKYQIIQREVTKALQTNDALVTRLSTARNWGFQYNGNRDISEALGYPKTVTLEDCKAMYRRLDIARAIINRPIQATWRDNFEVFEKNDTETTPIEKEWAILYRNLELKQKFIRVDKLACLGNYAILYMGFNDVSGQEDLSKPVQFSGSKKPQLLYVKPFGQDVASIAQLDDNPLSPRYGLPLMYRITFGKEDSANNNLLTTPLQATFDVHYTRVIHVVVESLSSEYMGEPKLEATYNRLIDLEKLIGGSAEMFWRGARPGYAAVINPEYDLTPNSEASLKDQLDEYENNLRRILLLDGVTIEPLAPQVSDPTNHVDVQIQMISSETSIPKRVLTGSERGELASTQDRDNWNDVIEARRDEFAERKIIRPFIDRCIEYKILPMPGEDGYTISWPDIYAPSSKTQAEIGQLRAKSLNDYLSNPIAMSEIPMQAFLTYFLGLLEEDVQYIMDLREQVMGDEERLELMEDVIMGRTGINEPGEEGEDVSLSDRVNSPETEPNAQARSASTGVNKTRKGTTKTARKVVKTIARSS